MASDRGLPSLPRNLEREMRVYLQALGATVQRLAGNVRGSEQARAVRVAEGASGTVGQGAITAVNIANKAVTTEKIVDGAVTERKIADGSVTAAKIADGSVETTHIKASAVTSGCLADGAVTSGKLGTAAVSASHLTNGAVQSQAIAAGAVTKTSLAKEAVTTDALASAAVAAANIQTGAVTADKLAPGIIPAFASGEAADGETVIIPGTWAFEPAVWIAGYSLSAPAGGDIRVEVDSVRLDANGAWCFDAVARVVSVDALGTETTVPGTFRWVAAGNKK